MVTIGEYAKTISVLVQEQEKVQEQIKLLHKQLSCLELKDLALEDAIITLYHVGKVYKL
jgi:hypothetical protein